MRANERLLALAKPYPGAKLVRVQQAPYSNSEGDYAPTSGYDTTVYYVLSREARPAAVAAFYKHELVGWHENVTGVPCHVIAGPPGAKSRAGSGISCPPGVNVNFTRGRAVIDLQLDGLAAHDGARPNYIVVVDHDANR